MRLPSLVTALCLVASAACSSDPEPQLGSESNNATTTNVSANVSTNDAGSPGDVGETPPDAGDAGMGSAPLIHEAELCPMPPTPDPSVMPGSELMKVTLQSPQAVCNDGSPAVMYVRPAPAGSPNENRWILWLESGGGCNSPSACQSRWCSGSVAKMTSQFAPEGIRGSGIFSTQADNDFGDWNHVVAYYCSSDGWTGRKRTLAVGESGAPSFELYLHGAYIVDDIIDTLKAGATSDDGTMTLASIDEADMFLFTGSSAGAGGARANADRVGEMLRASNPTVDYRMVSDAGSYPADPNPPELSEDDAISMFEFKHDVIENWRDGVTDESCLAYHSDEPFWCADNNHLMFHHITTPSFVKQDLLDAAPGPYADSPTYARVMLEWFTSVDDGSLVPEEPEVPIDQFGLFAPRCDHHLSLNVENFYDVRATNGTDELSMHDLLSNWVNGGQPTRALVSPGGLTSVCP